MSRTKGHTTKSEQERAAYVNYIRSLDYEPTKDEALDFSESTDNEPDYSIQKAKKVRRLSIWEQFQTHIEDNWIKWVIGGVAIVGTYFLITSKVAISSQDIKIEQSEKNIEIINNDIEDLKNTNHEQDLKIQKNELTIENIRNIQQLEK